MVGQTTLVNLLPAFAQLAQFVLHFSATHGRRFFRIEQGLGLGHQALTHLVGTPALPALRVPCCGQGQVDSFVQRRVQIFAVCFQGCLQLGQAIGGGLALSHLFFQGFQHLSDGLVGLLTQGLALGRIHFGFGRLGLFGGIACARRTSACVARGRMCLGHHFTAQAANFVGPHRHWRHGQRGIGLRQQSRRQCC